ncbi:MAG TPA: hypothetical protein VNO14_13120 [Blastocatellia bacterium]|nr:hypothetical protein [Blastocatellia bacterium]
MKTTVGIFTSRSEAEKAVERLRDAGIAKRNIDLLTPGAAEEEIEDVPTTDAEQPGMGKALGGVVGGALGASGGMSLGAATAAMFVPGVGPIIASGIIGAALFGIGGAAAGAMAGEALEGGMAEGLPRDELFVYEDALRRGRSVVIVLAEDDEQYDRAREVLSEAGAESVDSAREQWWIGLRDAEEERYRANGGDFEADERDYRRGFEAALHPDYRGRSFDESRKRLTECYGEACEHRPFRAGFERGFDYHRNLTREARTEQGK